MRPGAATDAPERSTGAAGITGSVEFTGADSGTGSTGVEAAGISDGGLAGSGGISATGAAAAASAGDGGVELSDSVGVADAPEEGGERFLGWFLRRGMVGL